MNKHVNATQITKTSMNPWKNMMVKDGVSFARTAMIYTPGSTQKMINGCSLGPGPARTSFT
jgi:hypothetical protein